MDATLCCPWLQDRSYEAVDMGESEEDCEEVGIITRFIDYSIICIYIYFLKSIIFEYEKVLLFF